MSEYVRREDTPAGGANVPTGEDGIHEAKRSQHGAPDQTKEEREERERQRQEERERRSRGEQDPRTEESAQQARNEQSPQYPDDAVS